MFTKDILKIGDSGKEVEELQLRLAGFSGTLWDGYYGQNTAKQVMQFQKDYMKVENPNGIADLRTLRYIIGFAEEYPINFEDLKCKCGHCDGFGNGLNKNKYFSGEPKIEAYYQYEYPGIHKAVLHTFRACVFYVKMLNFPEPIISCGYRCSVNNLQHNRTSTNHFGKAIDIDFIIAGKSKYDKNTDKELCDKFRAKLMQLSNFQIGWGNKNQKSLEPKDIAPTWIHMDIRCYEPKYLLDWFFVKNLKELDK